MGFVDEVKNLVAEHEMKAGEAIDKVADVVESNAEGAMPAQVAGTADQA